MAAVYVGSMHSKIKHRPNLEAPSFEGKARHPVGDDANCAHQV